MNLKQALTRLGRKVSPPPPVRPLTSPLTRRVMVTGGAASIMGGTIMTTTGGQSPAPMNAPSAVPPSVGTQPGQAGVILRAREVILSGPGSGVFGVNFEINENGFFTYGAGGAALNNLGTSEVPFDHAAPNTLIPDGHGNQVPQGQTTYSFDASLPGGPYLALTNANGSLILYEATTQAGPWVIIGSLEFGDTGTFVFSAPILATRPGFGTPETWHAMTLLNSWATGGRVPPQYRLLASPAKTVEIAASFTAPAGIAAGQAVWDLPSGYTVADPQSVIGRNVTTSAAVMFSVTTGSPQALNYQAGAAAGNVIDLHAFITQDA